MQQQSCEKPSQLIRNSLVTDFLEYLCCAGEGTDSSLSARHPPGRPAFVRSRAAVAFQAHFRRIGLATAAALHGIAADVECAIEGIRAGPGPAALRESGE